MINSIAKRYQGIEIDIVLTKDGHLVLSHDPWVHTTLCLKTSGEPIGERVLIRDVTLAELQSEFVCGGMSDKDFPQQVITRTAAKQARDNGVEIVLFAPNSREEIDKFCTWPADMLITDYPELGPCP